MSEQASDKATKVSVSFPDFLKKAIEREAEKNHGGNFSAVIQAALRKHLTKAGALAPDPREAVIDAVDAAIEDGLTVAEITHAIHAAREPKETGISI